MKFQNIWSKYTISNPKRETHCEFHQHRTMVKNIREKYKALWRLSQKWGVMTNLGQKCSIQRNSMQNCQTNSGRLWRKFQKCYIILKLESIYNNVFEVWFYRNHYLNSGIQFISVYNTRLNGNNLNVTFMSKSRYQQSLFTI